MPHGTHVGRTRARILPCAHDFLAAERILDTDFLKEAQRTLRARGLLVGIPRRGRLLCIDGELPAEPSRSSASR